MAYYTGYINPCWNTAYKSFFYKKQPITDNEINRWRSEGYNHESFTGEMYDSKNPMPDWTENIAKSLGIKHPGFVFYKMTTNDIMPMHVDHFSKYCEIFKIPKNEVIRCVVFLEDWKSGHYFEIGSRSFMNYKAGEYIVWDCDEPHFAANIGIEDRYTLQITGAK